MVRKFNTLIGTINKEGGYLMPPIISNRSHFLVLLSASRAA